MAQFAAHCVSGLLLPTTLRIVVTEVTWDVGPRSLTMYRTSVPWLNYCAIVYLPC